MFPNTSETPVVLFRVWFTAVLKSMAQIAFSNRAGAGVVIAAAIACVGPWNALGALVGAALGPCHQRPPACHRKVVGAAHCEIGADKMQLGPRPTQFGCVLGRWPPGPHPGQKRDDRGGPPAKPPQRLAVAPVKGCRTGNATAGQMFHQA